MNHLYIDIETTSGANLSSAGAYRYAEDEQREIEDARAILDRAETKKAGSQDA